MNKRTKTDRELLLDASLEFIMNSPEEVFDQYLKEAGEDGSELERRATDAIGAALARHESASADELIAALRAETAADEAMKLDAQRYRWLRTQPNDTSAPRIDVVHWTPSDESSNVGEGLRLDALDAAIDAAMGGGDAG